MNVTHRAGFFRRDGSPIGSQTFSGTLPQVTAHVRKSHPPGTHRIEILNDVEKSKTRGQRVRVLIRSSSGAFVVRSNPQPMRAYDKQGHGVRGNPAPRRRLRLSKASVAAIARASRAIHDAAARIGR